ncbi:MAG: hypothetical protein Roseis2KO_26900 [Roseivirga sp.]
MEVNDLIDERNGPLYKTINKQIAIELKENSDWRAETWDSRISNKTATVLYCDCPDTATAFTKELLRIQAQLKGFKLLADGQTNHRQPYENMQTLIKSLNHHFLNHKIAGDFIALGYSTEQLQEEDESTTFFLKDQLASSGHSMLKLSLFYLLLIDPLIATTESERTMIQDLFYQYNKGKFRARLQNIDKILQDWALADSYVAEKYMIGFLINAGVTNTRFSYQTQSYLSNEKNLPENGFFIGK